MKRTSIAFFITFLFFIIMSACQENMYIDWKLLNDKWYAAHKSDPGFITTPDGLCYKVIHQGYQRFPNSSSYVIVYHKGTLIDGSIFDTLRVKRDTLQLSGTVAGWREALPKMQAGGRYILYIPSKLGYDTASNNTKIPPNSVLIFDINLIDSY